MNKPILTAITAGCLVLFATGQESRTPYIGQEAREVKALSAEEVNQLLTGQGMGLAKAAELNHYPGPKHVLELSLRLALSAEQIERTKEIRRAMSEEAIRLGKLIIERERKLDELFASGEIDEEGLSELTGEIGRLQGQLRAAHLRAHLEMKTLLSEHQARLYDQLRGYGNGHSHGQHPNR